MLSCVESLSLAEVSDTRELAQRASGMRDVGFRNVITYSRKVFIPLTQLCRDVCHYCTFAQSPSQIISPYMAADEVIRLCEEAKAQGCKEALFTLGERPEMRYRAAREQLSNMGFKSTLEYLAHVAGRTLDETGILPHINAGCMTREEMQSLRPVSASMGLMLESVSERLCGRGMPHYGSPDKAPARRLETLCLAGELQIPFTTGILIGIGETRRERIESLLAIRDIHHRYGHIQEIIVQNFRAKPGTKMASAPEPDLEELLWTLSVARLIFGSAMSIQVPPNLSPGVLPQLLAAGINDWGGVSPVTPDHVNPEYPWPHLDQLQRETELGGRCLQQRLTIYPRYVSQYRKWVSPNLHSRILRQIDAEGFPRTDDWVAGVSEEPPVIDLDLLRKPVAPNDVSSDLRVIVDRALDGERLGEEEIVLLFQARGREFSYVCQAADRLRERVNGDALSYVVNRNINYTNVCYFRCQFCAFSKGKLSENLRGKPYDLDHQEIARRAREAWDRGATEICLQGGIHPGYTGNTYVSILNTLRVAVPDLHIHAFSPLEVWQGAKTLGIGVADYLRQLQESGLGSMPGTAAEILDDSVRAVLCPDKISADEWLKVTATAHELGLKTTATIMFGHVDNPTHWASHLLKIRDQQAETLGFAEFVPLPFVPQESPIYLKGLSRKGPTFREALLMHAVARLVLHTSIDCIQGSWVKLGEGGLIAALSAGVNDLGGTLMNESITRAAGASHGQEKSSADMKRIASAAGRSLYQRSTFYQPVTDERQETAATAPALIAVTNTPLQPDRCKPQQVNYHSTEIELQ